MFKLFVIFKKNSSLDVRSFKKCFSGTFNFSNIETMKEQLKGLCFAFDWERVSVYLISTGVITKVFT